MNTDFKRFGVIALTLLCSVVVKANDITKALSNNEQPFRVVAACTQPLFMSEDEEQQMYKTLQHDLLDVMHDENEEETSVIKQKVASLFQKAVNLCETSRNKLVDFWNQGNKQKAICLVAAGVTTYAGYKAVQAVMTSKTAQAAKQSWELFCYKNCYDMPAYATIAGSAAAVVAYEALTSGLIKNNLKVGLPVAAGAALAVYGLNKLASYNDSYATKCHTNYKSLPSKVAALGAGITAVAYELALRNSDSKTPGKMVANMVVKPAINSAISAVNTYATKETAQAVVNYVKDSASNAKNALSTWWNKAPQAPQDVTPHGATILDKVKSYITLKRNTWFTWGV